MYEAIIPYVVYSDPSVMDPGFVTGFKLMGGGCLEVDSDVSWLVLVQ